MAASSENLAASSSSNIDPFLLRQSTFSDLCWLNPADNETQTNKAIHQPFYGNHHHFSLSLLQPDHHQSFSPFTSSDDLQQTHPTPSTLDPKRRIAAVNNGKSRITKRKSRATKKNQTTFITADPANFRQMVQQVTGIRLDTSSPLSHLLKPETSRPIGRLLYNACLPTLDTSSFLLEHNQQQQQQQQSQSSSVMASGASLVDGETGYGASDGFGIASFPTLESWKVM